MLTVFTTQAVPALGARRAGGLDRLPGLRECAPTLAQQRLSGCGERDSPARALWQRHTEAVLETSHLLAE